jgi:hypothetical protein
MIWSKHVLDARSCHPPKGAATTMDSFICTACGTQYPPSAAPPAVCCICEEERQYVPPAGQGWTTMTALAAGRFNAWRQHEQGLISLGTQPQFAIGQRAILVTTPNGNVLWDCISMLDAATIAIIQALGGLKAMAISHPHFYTSMRSWSEAFGGVPIHLHADDADWIVDRAANVATWHGETKEILPDLTLVRCGGHFKGGQVLHWAKGAGGKGAVLAGDILTVQMDRKWLTFMRSYPNHIPLSASGVRGIGRALEGFQFEAIYGHYFDRVIAKDGKRILQQSVERYVDAITGKYDTA